MDVYHWHKYLQDLVIEIVGLETNIRVFRHFLALHHSILWVFEYLIKNGFILIPFRRQSAHFSHLNIRVNDFSESGAAPSEHGA